MKKILINDMIGSVLAKDASIFQRADVKILTARTNDDILSVHRLEKVNLIVSRVDAPGAACEQIFRTIRDDAALRAVSIILYHGNRPGELGRAALCKPNVMFPLPVNSAQFVEKAEALLAIPSRGCYRVLLSVSLNGDDANKSFFCRSENISATGLLLESDRPLSLGDRLACSFFLPGHKRITVAGKVVRKVAPPNASGEAKYGVQFGTVAPEDAAAIEDFVRKKAGPAS